MFHRYNKGLRNYEEMKRNAKKMMDIKNESEVKMEITETYLKKHNIDYEIKENGGIHVKGNFSCYNNQLKSS